MKHTATFVIALVILYGLVWFTTPHLLDPFLTMDRGSFEARKNGGRRDVVLINQRWALEHDLERGSFVIDGKNEEHNICMFGDWTNWQIQCRSFPGQARTILEQAVEHQSEPNYGLSATYTLERL